MIAEREELLKFKTEKANGQLVPSRLSKANHGDLFLWNQKALSVERSGGSILQIFIRPTFKF